MAIFIDQPTWPGHGRLWSHLISDTSYEELHAFAVRLGIPRRAFERDHYDLIAERFGTAVEAGARVVESREIVRLLTEAGLRQRKLSRLAR
ncbi:MAG: DUF4031 domain-containing protein [Propionibacteriales bacterium]|nr:DUF4031 domain-containing protein [Propionibacteriales bacterium]